MSRLLNDALVTGAFPDQEEDVFTGSMSFRTCKVGVWQLQLEKLCG